MNKTGIGNRLKQLRIERGYSQEEVAKLLHIGRTTYLKYESEENRPIRKLNEICSLFGVSADYLLGRTSQVTSFKQNHNDAELCMLKKYRALSKAGKEIIKSAVKPLVLTMGYKAA